MRERAFGTGAFGALLSLGFLAAKLGRCMTFFVACRLDLMYPRRLFMLRNEPVRCLLHVHVSCDVIVSDVISRSDFPLLLLLLLRATNSSCRLYRFEPAPHMVTFLAILLFSLLAYLVPILPIESHFSFSSLPPFLFLVCPFSCPTRPRSPGFHPDFPQVPQLRYRYKTFYSFMVEI